MWECEFDTGVVTGLIKNIYHKWKSCGDFIFVSHPREKGSRQYSWPYISLSTVGNGMHRQKQFCHLVYTARLNINNGMLNSKMHHKWILSYTLRYIYISFDSTSLAAWAGHVQCEALGTDSEFKT